MLASILEAATYLALSVLAVLPVRCRLLADRTTRRIWRGGLLVV